MSARQSGQLPPADPNQSLQQQTDALYQHWVDGFLAKMGKPVPPRTPDELRQALEAGMRATFDSWAVAEAEPITRNLDIRMQILHDSLREVRADGPQVTSQGYWIVEVACARTGLQTYIDAKYEGGRRVEYRSLEEITSPESLASWIHAPAIIYHQPVIHLQNSPQHKRGYVFAGPEIRRLDDGEDYLIFQVVLDHPELVDGVRMRRFTEVSPGYGALFVPRAGEHRGTRYDGFQTRIRINHLAFIPPGLARGGRLARVLLDSTDGEAHFYFDSSTEQGVLSSMADNDTHLLAASAALGATQRVYLDDKTSLDLPPAEAQLVQRVLSDKDGQITGLNQRITALESEKQQEKARADSLDTDKQALTTKVSELETSASKSGNKGMAKAIYFAAPILAKDKEFKLDSLETMEVHDVQLAALKAKLPNLKYDSDDFKDPVYVKAFFEAQIVNGQQMPVVGSGQPSQQAQAMYDSMTPLEQQNQGNGQQAEGQGGTRQDSKPNPYFAAIQGPTQERLNPKK